MFLRVLVRASTNSLVETIMVESESLSTESQELTDFQWRIWHFGVNGLLGVSGLSVGVWVQRGLDGECFGEGIGVPLGVLTGEGCSVSLGTKSLSSPLSKGEIIGSTGITLLDFLVRSVGSSGCLLILLSLFSCSKSSSSKSLPNYVLQNESCIFK